jgi:hypothetical protein
MLVSWAGIRPRGQGYPPSARLHAPVARRAWAGRGQGLGRDVVRAQTRMVELVARVGRDTDKTLTHARTKRPMYRGVRTGAPFIPAHLAHPAHGGSRPGRSWQRARRTHLRGSRPTAPSGAALFLRPLPRSAEEQTRPARPARPLAEPESAATQHSGTGTEDPAAPPRALLRRAQKQRNANVRPARGGVPCLLRELGCRGAPARGVAGGRLRPPYVHASRPATIWRRARATLVMGTELHILSALAPAAAASTTAPPEPLLAAAAPTHEAGTADAELDLFWQARAAYAARAPGLLPGMVLAARGRCRRDLFYFRQEPLLRGVFPLSSGYLPTRPKGAPAARPAPRGRQQEVSPDARGA